MSWTVRNSEELEPILIQLRQGQVSLLELAEALPHGSGIDSAWEVRRCLNGTIYFHNDYHAMNDGGYYDGHYPFKVTLFRHKRDLVYFRPNGDKVITYRDGDLDFKVTGIRGKYHDALDYVSDCVDCAWEKYGIRKPRYEIEGASK